MRKFIFMVAMLLFSIGAFAQTNIPEKTQSISNTFETTYVTMEGGAFAPMNFNNTFPVNYAAGVRVGKDFSPVYGANVESMIFFGSNYGQNYAYYNSGKNFVKALYVGLNGTVNIFNMLFGYNGRPRVIEMDAIAGFGWGHGFNPKSAGTDYNFLACKTGADIKLNLGKERRLTLFVEPQVMWNLSKNGVQNPKFDKNWAEVGLMAGLTYKLTANYEVYETGAMARAYESKIKDLEKALSEKPKEVVKEVPGPTQVVKVPEVQYIQTDYYVMFAKNSAELDAEAQETLNSIPRDIKVDIVATASPEGSKKYNEQLSQKRADNVKDYLEKRGVRVNKSVGIGANAMTSNRVAIIRIAE